uniref:Ribosomal protein L14 n=1 Tax=Ancoracysta twista TaxID=2044563 RepID=A0A2H4R8C4_9EUKA|nr:ribosomal protein L14 [Ancoracysta twista]ATY40911.1 ribosomal protein L14 [Ancoracysta twista]
MIYFHTKLKVADNSGGRALQCIKVYGKAPSGLATVGETVAVSIKKSRPLGKISKGEVHRCLVVRCRKSTRRPDGSYISFGNNAGIVLNTQNLPVASRIFGPIPTELRQRKFMKIISMAVTVL